MDQHPFPGRAGGGDVPRPGGPTRDGASANPGDDWDGDAEMAAFLADIEAGRARVPEPWEIEGPAATISLGDACDVDLAELAAMAGPDGLGGDRFAQDGAADVLRPGPVLAALAEQAGRELGRLSDNQLLGAVSAARRLRNRAEYLELSAVAEYTRRRTAQLAASIARKDPRGCREGEFADAELAMELVTSIHAARDRMDLAADLATRLPCTLAGLAAGTVDGDRARTIWYYTRFLSDLAASQADTILAAAAPGLRQDQLARKAAALEMKLDPEAVRRRRDDARRDDQRIETRREYSGNAALAGRELATADVMASKAHIDTLAAALRGGGLEGSLRELRVLVFLDLTQGRDPLDRIADRRVGNSDDGERYRDGAASGPGGPGSGGPDSPASPGVPPDGPAPLPALINLIIPVGTLLGWSDAPGDAGTWGLLDSGDSRAIVAAASKDPRTRWCLTVTGPDGTAVAHGCARGQHPWTPASSRAGPDAAQAAQLNGLLRRLNVTLNPIAKGECDHEHQEHRYTPSRMLAHLIRARTARCSAPGCGAQAYFCDLDHAVPYPHGPTDECNLHPSCRRHHRCKQAPGWKLRQPQPGIMRWTTPSGRTYITTPTAYDL